MALSKGKKITIFVIALLVIDQVSKILVKTNMTLGQSINVLGDWFQLYFVENIGMAFGMSFGGNVGKFLLSFFRIVLGIAMFIYIRKLIKTVPKRALDHIARFVISDLRSLGSYNNACRCT